MSKLETFNLDDSPDTSIPRTLPRGRHTLDDSVVKASQRLRLIEAITEVCAEKGYAAATVADVIERSGISRKTFYEHFANKEECFVQAYDEGLSAIDDAVGAAYMSTTDWQERLRFSVAAFLQSLAERPAYARIYATEVLVAGGIVRRHRDERVEQIIEVYRELNHYAHEADPAVPLMKDDMLVVIVGGIAELVRRTVSLRGPERLPDIADSITDFAWMMISRPDNLGTGRA
ncbi:MAG: TetR/AcrR family transcriptional regulator [Thermoleophilaceae bacterium]|nr:TetR/AcrR family transcriptional regulator [Thermoleophilaceae bacterium]